MAGKSMISTAKKLITALNTRGYEYSLASRQFKGTEGHFHNYYTINQHVWDDAKHKFVAMEVYSTASAVRLVLFLRDKWYIENGLELPTDQEQWNGIRAQLQIEGKL